MNFYASKWLHLPVLLNPDEMKLLFHELNAFSLYRLGSVYARGDEKLSRQEFFSAYNCYINSLKRGLNPDELAFRLAISSALTSDASSLFFHHPTDQKTLVRIKAPVIQILPHRFTYSSIDGKFRSMILGPDSITWGVRFSYPQLCEIDKIPYTVDERFANTALWKILQKWMRKNSRPAPFSVEGRKTNVPIRIGKACLSWIKTHPDLQSRNIACEI